jgi:transposase
VSDSTVTAETVESVRAEKDLIITALEGTVADLTRKLEAALYRIDQMSRRIFGRSSEQYDHPGQLRIDLGTLTPAAPAGDVTVIPPQAKGIVPGKEVRTGKAKRKPIPDTVEVKTLPAQELTEAERRLPDGRLLEPTDVKHEERLDYIAPLFLKIVQPIIIYGLPGDDTVTASAKPAPQIVPDGLPTTGLIIQVWYAKYGMHLPLHRQSKEYARLGLALAKSTMCGWLATFAEFINPVYLALQEQVLACGLIFSDDIPVDMLVPKEEGGSIEARFWSYLGDGQVLFSFATDRCGRHPSDMLKDYHGALMADALAQYQRIVAANGIWRLACWAHVRRKFYEARFTDKRAAEMVEWIAKLYAAERRATKRGLSGDVLRRWRWRLRQRYTARVLSKIKERLDAWNPDLLSTTAALPDSPLGKAIRYAMNQWDMLARFATTGDWPIDNNPAENAQRPIAVGRKNHLFMGSEGGGEMAATFYSIIQSCRLQGIDPVAYMTDVSQRLLDGSRDYAALTPRAWATERRLATSS